MRAWFGSDRISGNRGQGPVMQKDVGRGRRSSTMATGNPPSFEFVASALRQLGAAEGPTEAHGSLCGLTCVLGSRAASVWVARLVADGDQGATESPDRARVLEDLAAATCAALADGEMTFSPMLPPDDSPLSSRAEGLADWCAGFMRGLGEAAVGGAARRVLDGDVAQEIMDDFAEISRASLGDDDTDLEAEAAYTELVEFVRVSVQLIFEELHGVRQGIAAASVH